VKPLILKRNAMRLLGLDAGAAASAAPTTKTAAT
jgi:hypothetical protein